jgi:hypothetical protein
MWYSGLSTLILGIPPNWKKSRPKLPFLGSSLSTTYRNSAYISRPIYIYIYGYVWTTLWGNNILRILVYTTRKFCSGISVLKTKRYFESNHAKQTFLLISIMVWDQIQATLLLACTHARTTTHTKLLHRFGHLLPNSAPLQARQQTTKNWCSDCSNPKFHSITSIIGSTHAGSKDISQQHRSSLQLTRHSSLKYSLNWLLYTMKMTWLLNGLYQWNKQHFSQDLRFSQQCQWRFKSCVIYYLVIR